MMGKKKSTHEQQNKPIHQVKENDSSDNNVNVDGVENEIMASCKHEWECLRDRCHNRGKGKYMAYKCRLCNKFQRR